MRLDIGISEMNAEGEYALFEAADLDSVSTFNSYVDLTNALGFGMARALLRHTFKKSVGRKQ